MSLKIAWIPKSEKGREVVRTLKAAGYPATYENTMGRYLFNTPAGRGDLFQDVQTMVKIAFILDPESADATLNDAAARADAISVLCTCTRAGYSKAAAKNPYWTR